MCNLLDLMRMRHFIVLVVLSGMALRPAYAQSPAALGQLVAHHTEDEVDQMRQNVHYRYEGELLFYSASFLIEEDGEERPATEAEIAGIDLHAYDGIRMNDQRTGVHDPLIDQHVVLLGRGEFERLVLLNLNEADRAAFLAYKDAVLVPPVSKTR
jgi:hypothetical protein